MLQSQRYGMMDSGFRPQWYTFSSFRSQLLQMQNIIKGENSFYVFVTWKWPEKLNTMALNVHGTQAQKWREIKTKQTTSLKFFFIEIGIEKGIIANCVLLRFLNDWQRFYNHKHAFPSTGAFRARMEISFFEILHKLLLCRWRSSFWKEFFFFIYCLLLLSIGLQYPQSCWWIRTWKSLLLFGRSDANIKAAAFRLIINNNNVKVFVQCTLCHCKFYFIMHKVQSNYLNVLCTLTAHWIGNRSIEFLKKWTIWSLTSKWLVYPYAIRNADREDRRCIFNHLKMQ